MPVKQRRNSVRELNDIELANRGIIAQAQASAPITFQVSGPVANADSLQGNDWAAPAAIGSSVAAPGTFTILTSTAAAITSTGLFASAGTIDGIPIGSSARSSAAFGIMTSTAAAITSTAASISAGDINGVPIGSSAPAPGRFNQLIVPSTIPATSSSTGVVGEFAFDASFFYGCIGADSWARTALSTW